MSENNVDDFDTEDDGVYLEDIDWDDEAMLREKEAREAKAKRLQTRRSIEDWLETRNLRDEWGDDFVDDIA